MPGLWRMLWHSNFKNFMKTVLFPNKKNLLKSYGRCIFVCSASLPKVRKVILNAIFDFTYREFKKSSLPIISKNGFNEKRGFS